MKGTRKITVWALMALILGATSLPSIAGNTYYRWKDDRGNQVNSDRPPPNGVDYEVVSTGTNLVRKVPAEEGAVPPTLESSPGNEFERTSTRETTIKKNPEICARAEENLVTLNTYARIRVRDDQGEYRYIDEKEKAQQKAQAEELIRVNCD